MLLGSSEEQVSVCVCVWSARVEQNVTEVVQRVAGVCTILQIEFAYLASNLAEGRCSGSSADGEA